MEESVKCWEKKRFFYNLITVFGGLLVFFLGSEVPNELSPNGFYEIHPYLLLGIMLCGANILYCCGWGLEILLNHHFRMPFFSKGLRLFIFIGGSIFSFGWIVPIPIIRTSVKLS